MTTLLLKNAAALYTCETDDARPIAGYVIVRDGRIAEVGAGDAPVIDGADVIDCSGCVVTPGFINLHHHFFQAVTRAVAGAHRASSAEWLQIHYALWACMSADDLAIACRNAAAELALSGATTSADHAFILGGAGSEMPSVEIDAVREIGLRLHLVRACLPTIGGAVEERLKASIGARFDTLLTPREGLAAQCRADVARWHDAGFGSMLQFALGPSNVPYTQPDLLEEFARISADTGCGLHMHYHPRMTERAECRARLGLEPVELLARSGTLGPRTWLAHCTELDDDEIARFADTGTSVAHCPRTVLRLGYQVPRIGAMRAAGVRVGFGVDGAASNDGGSFLSDLRLGLLLHRCREREEHWLSPYDALRMATSGAAAVLGRTDIGMLKPGLCADLAVFRLDGVEYGGAGTDPLGALLLSGVSSRAFATIVNGKPVVRDARLVSADETALAAATTAASRDLYDRGRALIP